MGRLPKTHSGKILRGTMKKIADGDPRTLSATIDDPVVFDEIDSALKSRQCRRVNARRLGQPILLPIGQQRV